MMARIFFAAGVIEGEWREKEEGETTRSATSSDNREAVMNIHLVETNAARSGECKKRDRVRRAGRKREKGRKRERDSGGSEGTDKIDKRKAGAIQSVSIPVHLDKTRH